MFLLAMSGGPSCGGCSSEEEPQPDVGADAGDGGIDVGDVGDVAPDGSLDAGGDASVSRQIFFTTSAGGVVTSDTQRAVIGIGGQQPAGTASGPDHTTTSGPAAARP